MIRWVSTIAVLLAALLIVVAVVRWERRVSHRLRCADGGSGGGRVEGDGELLLGSVFISHAVASYAVMLAAWALALGRGLLAAPLAWSVLLAPLQVPIWLFLVVPLVSLDPTGRSSSGAVAGLSAPVAAAAAYAVYVPFFAASLRLVHGRRLRARRRTLGQCLECGYDLRVTPDRCPECGAAAAKASA